MSICNEPIPIDDEIIEFIQSRVDKDGLIMLGEEFKHGDRVIIKDGSFKGISGVFDRHLKDVERVTILLDSINFQANITVDRLSIERASLSL